MPNFYNGGATGALVCGGLLLAMLWMHHRTSKDQETIKNLIRINDELRERHQDTLKRHDSNDRYGEVPKKHDPPSVVTAQKAQTTDPTTTRARRETAVEPIGGDNTELLPGDSTGKILSDTELPGDSTGQISPDTELSGDSTGKIPPDNTETVCRDLEPSENSITFIVQNPRTGSLFMSGRLQQYSSGHFEHKWVRAKELVPRPFGANAKVGDWLHHACNAIPGFKVVVYDSGASPNWWLKNWPPNTVLIMTGDEMGRWGLYNRNRYMVMIFDDADVDVWC